MPKVKYVVCPRRVTSATDGQSHYISAEWLMRLYGVRPEECIVHAPQAWWPASYYDAALKKQEGLVRLYPKYNGDYTLP